MKNSQAHELTQLLAAVNGGDISAQEQLWSKVYDELKAVARSLVVGEQPGQTLHPTAIVNETWLRLFGGTSSSFENRRHFFASAARAMRQIRVDDVRKRKRAKRGGNREREALIEQPLVFDQDHAEVLAVHEALDILEAEDPQKAEIVMLRYFAGLNELETAAAMEISRRTVQSKWRIARAWLHRELSKGETLSETEIS